MLGIGYYKDYLGYVRIIYVNLNIILYIDRDSHSIHKLNNYNIFEETNEKEWKKARKKI